MKMQRIPVRRGTVAGDGCHLGVVELSSGNHADERGDVTCWMLNFVALPGVYSRNSVLS